jgi:hypothetical protein
VRWRLLQGIRRRHPLVPEDASSTISIRARSASMLEGRATTGCRTVMGRRRMRKRWVQATCAQWSCRVEREEAGGGHGAAHSDVPSSRGTNVVGQYARCKEQQRRLPLRRLAAYGVALHGVERCASRAVTQDRFGCNTCADRVPIRWLPPMRARLQGRQSRPMLETGFWRRAPPGASTPRRWRWAARRCPQANAMRRVLARSSGEMRHAR